MSEGEASLVWPLDSVTDPFDWKAFFGRTAPVEVELGSGDGSFMSRWAESHREVNFLGVERLLGRLRKLDRKGRRMGLTNLRLVRVEAAYLLEYLIPVRSVSAVHVYFPDPWPKRRHRHHRLINHHFTELCTRVLVPGGHVWLRTDNEDYFAQMREVFDGDPRFEEVKTPEEMASVVTDFEKFFNGQGIPTQRAGYRVVAGAE